MPYVKDFSMGDNESKWIAYRGGSFTDDGVAALVNLKTGKETIVADPQKENVRDIEFGKMEQWKFTASDGTEIDGYFCLPPGFDPQKKYPMIVYYYGGTAPTTSTFYHLYSPQTFASRDYVVYLINPSGTTGYGQEFSARHVNAWGKRTAEDIIEGVKLFCKEHSFVNDKKLPRRILRRFHDSISADAHRHIRRCSITRRHIECDQLLGRGFLGIFL